MCFQTASATFCVLHNNFSENHLIETAEFKGKHFDLLDVLLAFIQIRADVQSVLYGSKFDVEI